MVRSIAVFLTLTTFQATHNKKEKKTVLINKSSSSQDEFMDLIILAQIATDIFGMEISLWIHPKN